MLMYIWKVVVSGDKGKGQAGVLEFAIEQEYGKVVFMDAYSQKWENWNEMRAGFADYLRPESDAYETYLKEVGEMFGKGVDEEIFGYASEYGGCTADSSRLAYCFSSFYNNSRESDTSSSGVYPVY